MTARYVQHDEHVWSVMSHYTEDGEEWYGLRRRVPGRQPITLHARVRECVPTTIERKRRFRDQNGVIEFDSRGNITLREPGRRKRYTTTIGGLIAMCARQEAQNKAREKAFKRRTGR